MRPLRPALAPGLAVLVGLTALLGVRPLAAQSFEDEQREHVRVRNAFRHQGSELEDALDALGIDEPREIFLRVIKRERIIEVWVRGNLRTPFQLLRTLPICAMSGTFGPKRLEGDLQHPEGFYTLDHFNHMSIQLLSLRVSYPNASDTVLSDAHHPGGNIYIHGGCGSHGCLAITDEAVEWLYILAVLAHSAGQDHIPIHTFPVRYDDDNLAWLRAQDADPAHWEFWESLRPGWDYFEEHHLVPTVEVDGDGRYVFPEQ